MDTPDRTDIAFAREFNIYSDKVTLKKEET